MALSEAVVEMKGGRNESGEDSENETDGSGKGVETGKCINNGSNDGSYSSSGSKRGTE